MTFVKFVGNTSGNVAEVDASGNVKVNPPLNSDEAGCAVLAGEAFEANELLDIPRLTRTGDVSQDYRLRVGQDAPAWQDKFVYTSFDYGRYRQNISGMTVALTSQKIVLNSASSVAANNLAQVVTKKWFPMLATFPVYAEAWFDFQGLSVANNQSEIGLANWPGTTAAIGDGIVLRYQNGLMKAVTSFNGAEIETDITDTFTVDSVGTLETSKTYHLLIISTNEQVIFYINYFPVLIFDRPNSLSANFAGPSLQLGARVLNAASVPATACILRISEWNVQYGDWGAILPIKDAMAQAGHNLARQPAGATSGPLVVFANNTIPTVITALSNTVAPTGPTHSLPGGKFLLNALNGAETDYIFFYYLNPVPAATVPGKTMVVTKVIIDCFSLGAAVGASGNVFEWFLDVGSTALSLATADATSGTLAGNRHLLGSQTWQVAAPILTKGETIDVTFPEGIVVDPGTYFKVGLRIPIGVNTALLQFRGTVTPIGFWL